MAFGTKPRHVLQTATYPVHADLIDRDLTILPFVLEVAAGWFGCDFAYTWIDGVTFVLDDIVAIGGYLVPKLD